MYIYAINKLKPKTLLVLLQENVDNLRINRLNMNKTVEQTKVVNNIIRLSNSVYLLYVVFCLRQFLKHVAILTIKNNISIKIVLTDI